MANPSSSLQSPAWMSLWDKYFAPGDLRRRQQQAELEKLHDEVQQQHQLTKNAPPQRIDAGKRVRRQNALLYGGLAFSILSLVVTRRALIRKKISTIPKQFTPSSSVAASETGSAIGATPGTKIDGSLDALQALNYATMNVFSLFMFGTGAFMTYFDVADVEDLRAMLRRGVGEDVYGGESKADREIEGWIAEVLARRDGKGELREGVAEKVYEVQKEAERRKREEKGR